MPNQLGDLIKSIPDMRIQNVMNELDRIVSDVEEEMQNLREDIAREKDAVKLFEKKTYGQ